MHHITAHCRALQHIASHYSTLQNTAAHCSALQHTAARCSTLQYTAVRCSWLQHTAAHCSSLQHTAAYCNTIQHTATKCAHCKDQDCVSNKRRRQSKRDCIRHTQLQRCKRLQETVTHNMWWQKSERQSTQHLHCTCIHLIDVNMRIYMYMYLYIFTYICIHIYIHIYIESYFAYMSAYMCERESTLIRMCGSLWYTSAVAFDPHVQ